MAGVQNLQHIDQMGSVLQSIANKQIVLCAGPGGVGKTTASAALALAAAQAGRKALVLTIDPARRLVDALGVQLDNEPRRIEPAVLSAAGVEVSGELWALMLDQVRTFDDLIRRLAPDEVAAERLLNNHLYRQISRTLAGTLEYTAVEKLFDLRQRYDFDLIIVDTPPSKNVLDFIEAPRWLSRFLDPRIFRWFQLLDPTSPGGGMGRRLLWQTGRIVWEVLSRLFGPQFLGDAIAFAHAIEGMTAEFRRRADQIEALLASPASLFFVVASTDPQVLDDAAFLRGEIARRGIEFGGFVINRTQRPSGLEDPTAAAARVRDAGGQTEATERLAERLLSLAIQVDLRAEADLKAIDALRMRTGWRGLLATLPLQLEEITDIRALSRLAIHLTA